MFYFLSNITSNNNVCNKIYNIYYTRRNWMQFHYMYVPYYNNYLFLEHSIYYYQLSVLIYNYFKILDTVNILPINFVMMYIIFYYLLMNFLAGI